MPTLDRHQFLQLAAALGATLAWGCPTDWTCRVLVGDLPSAGEYTMVRADGDAGLSV